MEKNRLQITNLSFQRILNASKNRKWKRTLLLPGVLQCPPCNQPSHFHACMWTGHFSRHKALGRQYVWGWWWVGGVCVWERWIWLFMSWKGTQNIEWEPMTGSYCVSLCSAPQEHLKTTFPRQIAVSKAWFRGFWDCQRETKNFENTTATICPASSCHSGLLGGNLRPCGSCTSAASVLVAFCQGKSLPVFQDKDVECACCCHTWVLDRWVCVFKILVVASSERTSLFILFFELQSGVPFFKGKMPTEVKSVIFFQAKTISYSYKVENGKNWWKTWCRGHLTIRKFFLSEFFFLPARNELVRQLRIFSTESKICRASLGAGYLRNRITWSWDTRCHKACT